MTLKIGGTTVSTWVNPPPDGGGIALPPNGLSVMFDSTHFAYMTNLKVELDGVDNWGRTYHDELTRLTKNRALFYGSPGTGPAAHAARWAFDPKNGQYDFSFVNRNNWTILGDLYGDMALSNLVMVSSHGLTGGHYENVANGAAIPGENICGYASSVPVTYLSRREVSIGVGEDLPPMGTSGFPAVNCIYLDTCLTMSSDEMEFGLWPFRNYYSGIGVTGASVGYTENQAVMGYTCGIGNGQSGTTRCSLVLGALAEGLTLGSARQLLFDNGLTDSDGAPLTSASCRILGDQYTRASSVYDGTHAVHPFKWYQ